MRPIRSNPNLNLSGNQVRRLGAGLAAAAALLLTSVTPGLAFDVQVEAQLKRFLDCKILLLTDLQAHVRICGGGKGPIPPSTSSLSTPVAGAAPPPVVVAPIIVKLADPRGSA